MVNVYRMPRKMIRFMFNSVICVSLLWTKFFTHVKIKTLIIHFLFKYILLVITNLDNHEMIILNCYQYQYNHLMHSVTASSMNSLVKLRLCAQQICTCLNSANTCTCMFVHACMGELVCIFFLWEGMKEEEVEGMHLPYHLF